MKKQKLTKEEREYLNLVSDTRDLLKMPQGKKLLWHILSMCGMYADTFQGNSRTFYEEGKRAVGLEILSFLEEVDPTFYPRMLLEEAKKYEKEELKNGESE